MDKNKVWRLKSTGETYTDEEFIELLKSGKVDPKDAVAARDMKSWIEIENSIYAFYLGGKEDETV
ncbi:MAG: hypothetical protein IIZ47_03890 [Erysipelotrichaceae bacterium]|nr:hypothetical protein [Erysipelotrichaceae bacterium]